MAFLDALVDGVQIPDKPQPSGQSQLAKRNNNPANLRFAGQRNASKGEGGFAKFPSPEAGAQALYDQIRLDAGRGATLDQFIAKYAPPQENDTKTYQSRLRKAFNMSGNAPLDAVDPLAVARFIAQQESGSDLSDFQPNTGSPVLAPNPAPVRADVLDTSRLPQSMLRSPATMIRRP